MVSGFLLRCHPANYYRVEQDGLRNVSHLPGLEQRQRFAGSERLQPAFGPPQIGIVQDVVDMLAEFEVLVGSVERLVARDDADVVLTEQSQADTVVIGDGNRQACFVNGQEHPDRLHHPDGGGAAQFDSEPLPGSGGTKHAEINMRRVSTAFDLHRTEAPSSSGA